MKDIYFDDDFCEMIMEKKKEQHKKQTSQAPSQAPLEKMMEELELIKYRYGNSSSGVASLSSLLGLGGIYVASTTDTATI